MKFFMFELPTLKMFLICSYFYQFQPLRSDNLFTMAVTAIHSFHTAAVKVLRSKMN